LKKHVETNVSVCVSLRNKRVSFQEFSPKVRATGFQAHECRERKNPHREKFAKKNAKKKGKLNKNHWVLATVQLAKGGKERKTTIQYLLFALHGLKNMLVQTSAPGVRHFRIQNRSGGTGTDGR